MDVLVCLAGRAGEVVSRRELTDTVWATEFISDNTVSHAVADLRTALGDDARQPTYIETIQRRGYRLIAPVVAFDADEATASKVARFPAPAGLDRRTTSAARTLGFRRSRRRTPSSSSGARPRWRGCGAS